MFWFIVIFLILAVIAFVFDIGWLKTLLAVVLIIAAIVVMPGVAGIVGQMFPAFAAIVGAGSWIFAGVLLLGAYLLDPETVNDVVEAVGEVASKVTEVITNAASNAALSFLKTPLGVMLVAGLGIYLLSRGDDDRAEVLKQPATDDNIVNGGLMYG